MGSVLCSLADSEEHEMREGQRLLAFFPLNFINVRFD